MNNQTFAMIKPDAIKNGHLGKIIVKRGEYLRKFIFAILIFIANKRYLMPSSSEFFTNRKKLRQVVDIHGVKNDIHTDN